MTPVHFHPVGPDAATRYPYALGPPAPGQARTLCGLVVADGVRVTGRDFLVSCPACLARLG